MFFSALVLLTDFMVSPLVFPLAPGGHYCALDIEVELKMCMGERMKSLNQNSNRLSSIVLRNYRNQGILFMKFHYCYKLVINDKEALSFIRQFICQRADIKSARKGDDSARRLLRTALNSDLTAVLRPRTFFSTCTFSWLWTGHVAFLYCIENKTCFMFGC